MQKFYSHGKLLLTSEYLVLDGALALAVPTKFGQSLKIIESNVPKLIWKSLDVKKTCWFNTEIDLNSEILQQTQNNNEIHNRLIQILNSANQLNSEFLNDKSGYQVITRLEFPQNWGLGTSSTLINNIAKWANVDAYKLLNKTFGGSGYDIACAQHDSVITYQIENNKRLITNIKFNPSFSDQLFFVHLNIKQDSRKGIASYNSKKGNISTSIDRINSITNQILECNNLQEFESLITEHEGIISELIKLKPIKESLFKDYEGAIKSLGAWGGDFIMVTGTLKQMDYFKNKGYHTILNYMDMVL